MTVYEVYKEHKMIGKVICDRFIGLPFKPYHLNGLKSFWNILLVWWSEK